MVTTSLVQYPAARRSPGLARRHRLILADPSRCLANSVCQHGLCSPVRQACRQSPGLSSWQTRGPEHGPVLPFRAAPVSPCRLTDGRERHRVQRPCVLTHRGSARGYLTPLTDSPAETGISGPCSCQRACATLGVLFQTKGHPARFKPSCQSLPATTGRFWLVRVARA